MIANFKSRRSLRSKVRGEKVLLNALILEKDLLNALILRLFLSRILLFLMMIR